MGIESFIAKSLNQTAVYWGNPINNADGGKTFDPPIEIPCRWEEKIEVVNDNQGREIMSIAIVYTEIDTDVEGLLLLGTFNDLDSDMDENPKNDLAVKIIRRFDKESSLDGKSFIRKTYLT